MLSIISQYFIFSCGYMCARVCVYVCVHVHTCVYVSAEPKYKM